MNCLTDGWRMVRHTEQVSTEKRGEEAKKKKKITKKSFLALQINPLIFYYFYLHP